MVYQNFTVIRGDYLSFTITYEDIDTAPTDIIMNIKDKITDKTTVITKNLEDGIERTTDEGYVYRVFIDGDDTSSLKLLNYVYQITTVYGDDAETEVEGKIVITPEA